MGLLFFYVVVGVACAVCARRFFSSFVDSLGGVGLFVVSTTGALIGGAFAMALVPGSLDVFHVAGVVGAVAGSCFLLAGARFANDELRLSEE